MAYSEQVSTPVIRGPDVTIAPWEYLFKSFSHANFPDIFHPTWIAAVVLLVVLTVLYNLRTRALHRHPPYLDMWEWLFWSGLITFSLIVIEALFVFDFFLVLATLIAGLGTLVWIRFVRFPPFLAA
jgi:ABC-type xylose transport system permease subunit